MVLLEDGTQAAGSASSASERGSDFVGFMRAGDTLSPEALYEFARAIVDRDPRPDVLYCDEDHLAADGRTRCRPIFKPSWSPEMLLGYHYTGRLTLARSSLVDEVGGLDRSLGEAAEWDLMLRLSERTSEVVRVAHCLYHNGEHTARCTPTVAIFSAQRHSGVSPEKNRAARGQGRPAAKPYIPSDLAAPQASQGQRDHPDTQQPFTDSTVHRGLAAQDRLSDQGDYPRRQRQHRSGYARALSRVVLVECGIDSSV